MDCLVSHVVGSAIVTASPVATNIMDRVLMVAHHLGLDRPAKLVIMNDTINNIYI